MVVGPSTSGGKGKNVLLYYRCDNTDCEWKKKKEIKPRNLRGKIIKTADNVKNDVVVRLIFLNLFVNNEKVTEYRLKPPFNTMLKSLKTTSSRGGRIRTGDLCVPNTARCQLRYTPDFQ